MVSENARLPAAARAIGRDTFAEERTMTSSRWWPGTTTSGGMQHRWSARGCAWWRA